MASVLYVANIMKTCLKKGSIDFLHSRTISCLHRNFNKEMLREARVIRKIMGNRKKGKYVLPCIIYCFTESYSGGSFT